MRFYDMIDFTIAILTNNFWTSRTTEWRVKKMTQNINFGCVGPTQVFHSVFITQSPGNLCVIYQFRCVIHACTHLILSTAVGLSGLLFLLFDCCCSLGFRFKPTEKSDCCGILTKNHEKVCCCFLISYELLLKCHDRWSMADTCWYHVIELRHTHLEHSWDECTTDRYSADRCVHKRFSRREPVSIVYISFN